MRILFIDDKVENFKSTIKWLNRNVHQAQVTSDIDGVYKELSNQINQLKYDLVFIDEDFEDVNHLNYSIKSGYDLIEKLSTVNKFCPIIYFSGTNPHPKITHDATGKLDACYYIEKNDFFSAKMLKEIEEIWNLKDVKKVIENRKESLEAELFNYVLNMDSDEKASWYKETEKGEGANWENFMVKIFDSEISVHELFVSAYVDNYSTLAINGKVRMLLLPDLANALKVDAKDCLQKYLSLSLSEKVETESIIHKIALNYSLNILSVLIEYEETDQVCALNKYNINYSNATDDFKAKKYDINFMDKWSLFINKLALRRVCFLVYYLATNNKTSYSSYGLNDISLIEPEIFCLFKEGFTHPKKVRKRSIDNKVVPRNVSNPLGIILEIKNSFGLIDGRRDLFDDEKEWLKKTDNILFIFNFLNKIACKPTDLNILRDVYQNSQDRKLFKNEVIHELTLLLNPIKDKDIRKALNEEVISVFK